MEYGFIYYTGRKWHNSSVDTYNRACGEVIKREVNKPISGSLAHKELEFYKDQKHKTFIQLSEIII